MARALERAEVRTYLLDLRSVVDKDSLLLTWAAAIAAPDWTGRNWDAIDESMRDLHWDRAARYAVIVTGGGSLAREDPRSWAMLLDILRDAAADWASRGVPMAILVRGSPVAGQP